MQLPSNSQMYDFAVLRQLRKREGLSIADLSSRSGISPAVISKLERNQTLAGLDTLYKIGRVFGMNPSALLQLCESESARLCTATEHTRREIHFQEVTFGKVRCLLGEAPTGARLSRPEIHRDDYEVCWVLSGVLRFYLPNERHELSAGEAIQFDAVLEHTYEVLEPARFLILHVAKDGRF